MSPPRKKTPAQMPAHDINQISGEVGGNAVVVQGSDARVEIRREEPTPSEIRRQAQVADMVLLKHTLLLKLENLKKQTVSALEKGRNPYRFGQALSPKEAELLAGRDTVISSILESLNKGKPGFLAGNGGSGKTSLLQAGLIPHILQGGGLPILISVASGSLEMRIKREFLGEVTQTLYLSQVPLSTFLRHVIECLLQSKHVYMLIDGFEDFLNRAADEREAFKQEWMHCVSDCPHIHWLFSTHLGYSHLLNLFRPEINPFADLTILPPLDRAAAREAIVRPGSICGFTIEESVVENILERLGGSSIDPGQLQTVCYLMAGGNGPARLHWTMSDYERSGRADGIIDQSLDQLIGQLNHADREIAWRILASVIEGNEEGTTRENLKKRLKSYGVEISDMERALRFLLEIHLVDIEDEQYRLANPSIQPRIQQWVSEQRALVQARREAMNQLRQLRNSALRGLFGGVVGFILFDQLMYTGPVPDLSFLISFLISAAAVGAIAGFLLTLTIDLSIAAYRGPRAWIRYLFGGIGGIIAFVVGLLLYINNSYVGNALLGVLPATAMEGGLWGLVIGLGTTFALSSTRRVWLIALATAVAAGLTLLGLESILSVLINEAWEKAPSAFVMFLAGGLTPLCYIAAALFRRPVDQKWR